MDKTAKSVLLVDDESRDLEVLGDILEMNGYQVLRAANADEAIVRASELSNAPDIIVTDVSLPDMNGLELHRRLSKMFGRNLDVLFISAYSGAEPLRFHGIPFSDIHFLAKPFTAEDLTGRVRQLLTNPIPLSIAS